MKPLYKTNCRFHILLSFLIILMGLTSYHAHAQSMGISSGAITPDASSILELRTTTKGMLIPRMTTTERNAISSPATGLMIYNTTTSNFNFYNGSSWTVLFSGSSGVNSIAGTTNRITIGGTSADPTIDVSSGYVGQSSITTLGTIATGTWNGTIITSGYGGTGNGFTKFTGPATSEKTFTLPNASATVLTDNAAVTVAQGGTGVATLASNGVLYGNGTGAIQALAVNSSATVQYLSQVSSGAPTWVTPTNGTVTSVSGTANRISVATGTTTPVIDISASYVGQSSITTLGTIGTGTWNGTVLDPTYGGTGVNNGSKTITLGGNLVTSGAFATTLTSTATTNATLPAGTNTLYSTKAASITSAQLLASLSDPTGTGVAVFGTSPTLATPVINGLPTGTGVASAATASTLVARDANANISVNNSLQGYTTTATAAGTTTLAVGDTYQQYFTGSTTQTVKLPVTSTLVLGQRYLIVNNSSGIVTVQSSGANSIQAMAASSYMWVTCILTSGTGVASWNASYVSAAIGAVPVTSVSGTSNRITSTGGTTPVIDISASYVGQSSITTLGTIATGTWNGTIITSGYGGTGNGFTKFTGPATSEKTFTLPNASATILTDNAAVTVAQGGTGVATLASNGVLYGNGTSAVQALAVNSSATVQYLSQVSSGAPTWVTPTNGTVTSVSGTANRITVATGTTTPVIDISASYVGQSSITTLGTISTGTWNGTVLDPTYGGTGVNNGTKTITLGGNLVTSGAFATTLTSTATTNATLPAGTNTLYSTKAASITSAQLLASLSDPTGTGVAVFGTSPTLATPVINGLPTGTGVASSATASTLVARDANTNISVNNSLQGYTTTTTAAGTTTLTVGSTHLQYFTGSTTQTVTLPVASTLVLGQQFFIVNNSTGIVTVQSSGANTIQAMVGGSYMRVTCILTSGTSAASWGASYVPAASSANTANTVVLRDASGNFSAGTITGTITGNASTATALATGRTIGMTGDVTWTSPSFDGTANVTAAATVTKINGTALSGLATGILKNTTGTGVPSIAVAGDFPTLNQNTTGSAATLTTPRAIYGNNFDGSAALAQIIASTYGGTGNGFTKFTGPATSEKTFTLPNASATILTDNAAVTVAQGGTGVATLASNGVLYGNGTGAVQALAVNSSATVQYLSQVSSGAPTWQTPTGVLVNVRFITSGTTYTPTTGTKAILIEMVGGGGGGGGVITKGSASAGGGAGGYIKTYVTGISDASTYTIAIGGGGAGGIATGGATGTAGGATTFTTLAGSTPASTTFTCNGGGGGTGSNGGGTKQTDAGGAGGTSTNGNLSAGGAPGGWTISRGNAEGSSAGAGGSSQFGGGGVGIVSLFGTVDLAGNAGSGKGAGGGGAYAGSGTGAAGGAGSGGIIIIYEYR